MSLTSVPVSFVGSGGKLMDRPDKPPTFPTLPSSWAHVFPIYNGLVGASTMHISAR